ncbi:MAG: hypothetical protein AB7Q37_07395 [Pyrinomonadaceae bacterium]
MKIEHGNRRPAMKTWRGIPAMLAVRTVVLLACIFGSAAAAFGVEQSLQHSDDSTLIIESSPDMEIISFSKRVIVRDEAKGVLVFGADVIVEGRVEGDVAAIGGSVIQRENAYIGGDIAVIGGKYAPDAKTPLRDNSKQTIIIAAYEEELREFAQDPSSIFAPNLSVTFLATRVVAVLFWFILTFVIATIAPGAISRAVERLKVSSTKIFAVGLFVFIGLVVLLITGLSLLPTIVSAVLLAMAGLVLTLIYVFGRVALHLSLGKVIQKYFLSSRNHSEAIAILLGVAGWTLLLSVPYLWIFAVLAMFAAGVGLTLTARPWGRASTP